jgi:hypothetical protein
MICNLLYHQQLVERSIGCNFSVCSYSLWMKYPTIMLLFEKINKNEILLMNIKIK